MSVEPALKRKMVRALLEEPGRRMTSWPFQEADVPEEDQFKALEAIVQEAPKRSAMFEGAPHIGENSNAAASKYLPGGMRLTKDGVEWARRWLAKSPEGTWSERSADHLEGLRAVETDDERQAPDPEAFDRGMQAVSRLTQAEGIRHMLKAASWLGGVVEGLSRSTSSNFFVAYLWRAFKIALAIKIALHASSWLPGDELLRDLLREVSEVGLRMAGPPGDREAP